MATVMTLTDRTTGEAVYPVTSARCVIDNNGVDADTRLKSLETAMPKKVDAVPGMGLSHEDYTAQDKAKVSSLPDKVQRALTPSDDFLLTPAGSLSLMEEAKRSVFNAMWNSIGGEQTSDGAYRMGADGRSLTYTQAIERYNMHGFVLLWNAACRWTDDNGKTSVDGTYNEATGYFELHGITDIMYEEAIRIYKCFVGNTTVNGCRTFLRLPYYYQAPRDNGNRYTNRNAVILKSMFATPFQILNTSSLREISTIFLSDAANSIVIRSSSLEYIGMSAQNASAKVFSTFDIRNASNFRLDGMSQILRWVRNSTIAVHPNVYAKLTGDTTNPAAAALTPQELAQWMGVLTDAVDKNITFATA